MKTYSRYFFIVLAAHRILFRNHPYTRYNYTGLGRRGDAKGGGVIRTCIITNIQEPYGLYGILPFIF